MKLLELGDTLIGLRSRHRIIYGKDHVVFVNVHQDEETSIEAAETVVAALGGYFYHLSSIDGGRNVSFGLEDDFYVFDPNRMFTDAGRRATIKENSRSYSWEADLEVGVLANALIAEIVRCQPKLVIAVHNNKPEEDLDEDETNYSVLTYASSGEDLTSDVAFCHVNESINPNDFFFTTERGVFSGLRDLGHNVVLQNPDTTEDDGSLSLFCALAGIPYVNVEAQKGHFAEQVAMIQVLLENI